MRDKELKRIVHEVKSILESCDTLNRLQFKNFIIEKDRRKVFIYNTQDELIFKLDSLSSLSVDLLRFVCGSVISYEENVNNWIYRDDEKHPTWETPNDKLQVSIDSRHFYSSWSVSVPKKFNSSILYNYSPDTFKISLINALLYMQNTNPYRVEYMKRLEEIAREKFKELPGIGEGISNKLVRNGVYTYEDLLKNQYKIKHSNQKQKAIEYARSKADTDEEIDKHPDLLKIKEKVTLENL